MTRWLAVGSLLGLIVLGLATLMIVPLAWGLRDPGFAMLRALSADLSAPVLRACGRPAKQRVSSCANLPAWLSFF